MLHCGDFKYVANACERFSNSVDFRAVALVLGSDQDNLQSIMPFKNMPCCFSCCDGHLRQQTLVLIRHC